MGKGIRGRLADAAAAVAAETPPETPAAKAHPGNRGGITKRIQAAEIDSSEPAARAGGVRKRIEINVPKVSETPPEQPLTKSLKKAWAAGRTITSDALQFSQDAKSSGASSLGPMSDDTKSSTNNFRKMKRAVGYPSTAAPIKYIEIPKGKGGFLHPHPVLDPVDQFSRAILNDEKSFNVSAKTSKIKPHCFGEKYIAHAFTRCNFF